MVGEHRQLYLTLDCFLDDNGDVGVDVASLDDLFTVSIHICGTTIFGFSDCSPILGCSAILVLYYTGQTKRKFKTT